MKRFIFPTDSYLKSLYHVLLEVGLIITLLGFLVLTNINLKFSGTAGDIDFERQELVPMEEIEQTIQKERPPSPPRPAIPVEVPNSEIVQEEFIAIDAEIDFDEPLEIPPPPAAPTGKKEEVVEEFFVVVEEMPVLLGGIQAIQEQIIYPDVARKANIEGLVIIQFVVNEEGNVENPHVIRGIGGGCDEEAMRVIKKAKFKPGKQRGKAVRVQYSIPVFFKLKT